MAGLRSILITICLAIVAISSSGKTETRRYDIGDGLSSTIVGGGVQDRNGLLWFASWNGLNCYDGYDFHWVKIQPGDNASIGSNLIRDILLLPNGNILCHNDNDIYEFDVNTYTFNDISAARKDSLMSLVGHRWHGLHDSQGGTWVSDNNGLYKTVNSGHIAGMLEGTAGTRPRALMVDSEGDLWVGMRGTDSVAIYDKQLKLRRKFGVPSSPYCIYETRSGDVWIGCKPGALLRPGGKSIADFPVYDLKEDRYGRLWVATFGEGVRCIENPTHPNPKISPSLGGVKVRKLLITPSDNIIASTTDGLLIGRITPIGEQFKKLRPVKRNGKDPHSLSNNSTLSVAQDGKGRIFVCTESSGIDMISEESLFSPHPHFTHINTRTSSIGADDWSSMTLDSDSLLYLAGKDKVVAYNPLTDEALILGESFWADTCRFVEVSPVILNSGELAFGAEGGVFITSPNDIFSREYIPPIVYTTLSVNGGAGNFILAPLQSIDLPADARNLTIGFAALDYVDNKSILYRVSVDGSPWTDATSTRTITLFNMLPGDHEIEVQSTDRYGRWVDNHKILVVNIAPYWYETWWSRTLFLLLILLAVGGILYGYLYVRRINRQRSELLEKYMQLMHEKEAVSIDGSGKSETESVTQVDKSLKVKNAADEAFLQRITNYIERNLDNPDANIDEMAEQGAVSRATLNRRLRSILGVSALQLITEARMQNALVLLEKYDDVAMPVAEVALRCGYTDVYYFRKIFKKKYGKSPLEYRSDKENTRKA